MADTNKTADGLMGVIGLEAWGGFGSGSARPREQFFYDNCRNSRALIG